VTLVPHVTWLGQAGVDLYVDNIYRGSGAPEADGKLAREWFTGKTAARREISFYLPYGRPLAIKSIVLPAGARLWPARPYAVAKPVVYYGSSITQGSAAANPGGTYLALLSRWLDADFINLGFSGNGLGEPALARAVAELDASCFVVDYWANPTTAIYRATLPAFIDVLRAKHPATPILVTGPYYNPSEDVPGEAGQRQIEKRAFGREFVAARRAAGDRRIVWVDGLEMISRDQADGLVDGRHGNSMGYYLCARGLEPYLRTALGLPARRAAR
jgi:lysophospholipase L1-like esterase